MPSDEGPTIIDSWRHGFAEVYGEFTESTCWLENMSTNAEAVGGSESDDELPQLSKYAQAALQEFYQEQAAREQALEGQLELGYSRRHPRVQEDWVKC